MKTKHILLVLIAAFSASCGKNTTNPSPAETSPASSASPELQRVLSTPVTGPAMSIAEARKSAKPGETITIEGRIMGSLHPFVEGRAAFILADPEHLKACNENPGDGCETPWDTCCQTPEEKKQFTASIRILGGDGRVLKQSIEGVGGIGKLSKLVVTGKVAKESSADLLLIDASALKLRQ